MVDVTVGIPEDAPIEPRDPNNPDLILAWDSVNTTTLQECPYKFKLQIIEGWVPKKMAPPLSFGILFHSVVERYEHLKTEYEFDEALHKAVRYAFEISEGYVGDADQPSGRIRTRYTLVRAIIWYADKYKDDKLQTEILANGKPAVELSFRLALPLSSPLGTPYIYCGHIDRVVRDPNGDVLIDDYKTTKSTITNKHFRQFDSSWQMSGYTFAGHVILPDPPRGVNINALQLAVGFTRFARGRTERTPEQLEEWLDDFIAWIKLAEGFAESKNWPMNRQSCNNYGGCVFKEVCDRSPSVRQNILKANFKKEPWNPLENRGV